MESICRAIAYATLLYWIEVSLDGLTEWDTSLVRIIAGWLALRSFPRAPLKSTRRARAWRGVCWAPIDSPGTAGQLVAFLQGARARAQGGAGRRVHARYMGATGAQPDGACPRLVEPGGRAWRSRPRWASGARSRAGLDLDQIEMLAERYIYDGDVAPLPRPESLVQELHFEHSKDDSDFKVGQREPFFINGQSGHNPFKIYAGSQLPHLRRQTARVFPRQRTGGDPQILRLCMGIVNSEDRYGDEYKTLNVFPWL